MQLHKMTMDDLGFDPTMCACAIGRNHDADDFEAWEQNDWDDPNPDEDRPDFDFETEADRLMIACGMLADIKLTEILEAASRADTLGPLLEPTAYAAMLRRTGQNMHDIEGLASNARTLVSAFLKIREKIKAAT